MTTAAQLKDVILVADVKFPIPRMERKAKRRPRAYYGLSTKLPLDEFAAKLLVANEERAARHLVPLTDEQLTEIIQTEFRTPSGERVLKTTLAFLRNKYNDGRIDGYLPPPYLSVRYLSSGLAAAKGAAKTAFAIGSDLVERAKSHDIENDPRIIEWSAFPNNPYPYTPIESDSANASSRRKPTRSRRATKASSSA